MPQGKFHRLVGQRSGNYGHRWLHRELIGTGNSRSAAPEPRRACIARRRKLGYRGALAETDGRAGGVAQSGPRHQRRASDRSARGLLQKSHNVGPANGVSVVKECQANSNEIGS